MEKCHLRNFFLGSKINFEIGRKCFIVSGGSPDSTYYSNLLISCSILPNQSINLQIKSRPSLKGKTHFLNENKQKVSRFLKARKWSPYFGSILSLQQLFFSKKHSDATLHYNRVSYRSLGPQPVGVQCPLTSSLDELLMLLGLALLSWATACVGVHHIFPFRLPYLRVFPFTLPHVPLDFLRFFFFFP